MSQGTKVKGESLEIFREHRGSVSGVIATRGAEPDVLILEARYVPDLRQQKLAVGFFLVIEKNGFSFLLNREWRPQVFSCLSGPTSLSQWV